MPTVAGSWMEETLATINYEIRVMADERQQLESVIVRDEFGMRVEFEPTLEPCTSDTYIARANGIARNRFPLNVEVVQCDGSRFGPDENPRLGVPPGFGDPGPFTLPCTPAACPPNPACDRVDAEAQSRRAGMSRLCREVEDCRRTFREYLAMAAGMFVAFVILFAFAGAAVGGGGWIGAIIGAVLFAIAAAIFAFWLWLTVQAANKRVELNRLERELQTARALFEEALRLVFDRCCPGCFDVNTEMPC